MEKVTIFQRAGNFNLLKSNPRKKEEDNSLSTCPPATYRMSEDEGTLFYEKKIFQESKILWEPPYCVFVQYLLHENTRNESAWLPIEWGHILESLTWSEYCQAHTLNQSYSRDSNWRRVTRSNYWMIDLVCSQLKVVKLTHRCCWILPLADIHSSTHANSPLWKWKVGKLPMTWKVSGKGLKKVGKLVLFSLSKRHGFWSFGNQSVVPF